MNRPTVWTHPQCGGLVIAPPHENVRCFVCHQPASPTIVKVPPKPRSGAWTCHECGGKATDLTGAETGVRCAICARPAVATVNNCLL